MIKEQFYNDEGVREEEGDVVREISTPQGEKEKEGLEGRLAKLIKGIEEVVDKYSIPPNYIVSESEFIILKLKESGFVTANDEKFSGFEFTLKDLIKEVAKNRIANIGKSKFS
jgi:hypothetical protein